MKILCRALCALLLAGALCLPGAAAVDTPYDGYAYNEKGNAVAAPVGYVPQKVVSGRQLPPGSLGNAADLFVDGERGRTHLFRRGSPDPAGDYRGPRAEHPAGHRAP